MKYIQTELSEGVFIIRLDRPKKLNSFITPMAKELQEALKEAGEDDKIRCVLLTGNGKAFSAGQDLPEAVEMKKDEDYVLGDTLDKGYNPIIKGIRYLEKPVVCAVNGTAAGAGANIAFSCDIVIASKEAKFIQSFSKIGLIPDSGGTYFLPRLVGIARANALYLLDDKVSAEEAVEIGLIYKAADHDSLMNEATKLCQKLAEMPTKGFGLYKRAINQSLVNNLNDQLELEKQLQTEAGESHDFDEGVQAFLEKRKPEFKGK